MKSLGRGSENLGQVAFVTKKFFDFIKILGL